MKLELAILRVLAESQNAIPVPIIVFRAKDILGDEPTHTDTRLALRSLEKKGHVKGTANDDLGTMWKETDDGRLRIS